MTATSYEYVHAGDVILGHDGQQWGVRAVTRAPSGLSVTLVRYGEQITGWPPAGTEVTVLQPSDVSEELRAVQELITAFGSVELISEEWSG